MNIRIHCWALAVICDHTQTLAFSCIYLKLLLSLQRIQTGNVRSQVFGPGPDNFNSFGVGVSRILGL